MSEPVFSIAIIARNEAQNLPRLFASLHEYTARGGQVVIVDTGSDDDTVAIGRDHGARVVEMPGKFDVYLSAEDAQRMEQTFARGGETLGLEVGQRIFHMGNARHFATQQAARDFVFMPDGSDELLAFDVAWLDEQLREGRASGFSYRQQYGTGTLMQSRFYDRRLREWRGTIHEALFDRDDITSHNAPPSLRSPQDRLWLRHHRGNKVRNYMAGMALDALADPTHSRWQHYLGREFFYFGKWHSAIALLETHAANPNAWILEQNESLCLIGRCWEELGDDDAARDAYLRARKLNDSRREPLLRLAQLSTKHGDFKSCSEYARAALRIPSVGDFSEADINYRQLPHALLYWSLFWLGERTTAHIHWQKCRAFVPQDAKVLADAKLFEGIEADLAGREPVKLHILTRCSRIENILKVKDSVFRDGEGFDVTWHVLFDAAVFPEIDGDLSTALNQPHIQTSFSRSIPGDLAHSALNAALDRISDGWVYVLDDDNLLHEDFYPYIRALMAQRNGRGIIFSQRIDGRDFTGLMVREAKPENVKIQKIDMGQFLLRRDLIGEQRFDSCDYLADGRFIEEIFKNHEEEFVIVDEILCYYNYFSDRYKHRA